MICWVPGRLKPSGLTMEGEEGKGESATALLWKGHAPLYKVPDAGTRYCRAGISADATSTCPATALFALYMQHEEYV